MMVGRKHSVLSAEGTGACGPYPLLMSLAILASSLSSVFPGGSVAHSTTQAL